MRNPAVAEERCRSCPSLNGTVRITIRPLGRVEPVDGRQLPACRQRESNPWAIQRFMSRPETGFGIVPQPDLMRSMQERVVRETRTLRAMRRGLETAYGSASEALPEKTGSRRIGRTYGAQRQSSTLP